MFCHGTCFDDKYDMERACYRPPRGDADATDVRLVFYREWTQISLAAEKLKQGAFFISTTQVLRTGLFEVVKSLPLPMSWGTATAYIHVRAHFMDCMESKENCQSSKYTC